MEEWAASRSWRRESTSQAIRSSDQRIMPDIEFTVSGSSSVNMKVPFGPWVLYWEAMELITTACRRWTAIQEYFPEKDRGLWSPE